MKVHDVQGLVERKPFRPFAVRLSSGAKYSSKTSRDLGVTKDYHLLFYFAESSDAVRIDADSIVEIFER